MGALVLGSITKSFGGAVACSGINLEVGEGEFFTFLGPSGCGKTTLLRLIAGFIAPDAGTIRLGGRDITGLPPEKREVGMVFQNYSLFPFLTVRENIGYGLAVQKRPAREIRASVDEHMEMIGLSGFGERKIAELSGGEQQRVALARSLAVRPKVLLMDEPLSNLDARLRDKMRGEIKSLQSELGITTIFVTHDQTEALTLSDRVAVFNQGRIIQTGSPEDVYERPETAFVAGFLGDANLLPVAVRGSWAEVSPDLRLRLAGTGQGSGQLFIRPQDVEVSPAATDGENCFRGRLAQRQLNGVWIDYAIEVQGVTIHAVALNTSGTARHLRPGQGVWVSLPPDRLTILDA